jgi:hypothetical protein
MDVRELISEAESDTATPKFVERPDAPLLVNRTPSKSHSCTASGTYDIKQESPRQRLVLELASAGKMNKEIAEITGYHPSTVAALLRQPLTQQTMVNIIRQRVDNIDQEVVEIIKEGCLESAKRLLGIIKNDKAKGSDHIAAANTFLERRYGKANQPINRNTDVDLNTLSDAELARHITSNTSSTSEKTDVCVGEEGRVGVS